MFLSLQLSLVSLLINIPSTWEHTLVTDLCEGGHTWCGFVHASLQVHLNTTEPP